MAQSLDKFLESIRASGLPLAGEIDAFLATNPSKAKDAEQLARLLVKEQKLTAYQAKELYAGRGKQLVFGNYVVLDKLGQGGMGMVLKAEHKRMQRLVALKVLSPSAVKSPDAVKRFQREVTAAAKLTHPNIVNAYDADEANGQHFLVMEYVEGSDLSQLVKKNGPLSVDKALHCILQAARGLEYAHKHGVIHRDIKPSNLLIDGDGTVKILDMGLARIESASGDQAELTGTGQIMGTVDYMAPEQAINTRTADHRADIYALGYSLWFLLTGRAAYSGETVMEKLMAHQQKPIPSLAIANTSVPPALDKVFARMSAKTPAERYQSMGEVIADLQQCQTGKETSPTITFGPSEDNKLSEFLKNPSLRSSTGAKPAVAPAPQVAVKTDAGIEQTINTPQAELGTDPKTEQHLPNVMASEVRTPAAAMPAAKPAAAPTTTWTADWRVWAGGGGAGVALMLGLVLWAMSGGKPGPDPARINVPVEGDVRQVQGESEGFVPLFNGKDLTGWKQHPGYPGNWRVENGVLAGSNGGATFLFTERNDYANFHLHLESRVAEEVTGGVDCRATFPPPTGTKLHTPAPGYLAKINATSPVDGLKTGGLYVIKPDGMFLTGKAVSPSPVPAGQWFEMDILCQGDEVEIRVDGNPMTKYTDPERRYSRGHIALQAYYQGAAAESHKVEFRKIEIKELPPSAPAPASPGGGIKFDGRTKVAIDALEKQQKAFTVEAWVKPTSAGNQTQNSHVYRNRLLTNGAFGLQYFRKDGVYRWMASIHTEATGYLGVGVANVCELDQWAHVAAVFDGSTLKLYVNGKAEPAWISFPTEITMPILPGNIGGGEQGDGSFVGEMRTFRISRTARYKADFDPQPQLSSDGDTLVFYDLEHAAGPGIKDESAHGHRGNVVTAPARAVTVRKSDGLIFDGKSSYVVLPSLQLPVGKPVTVEAIVTAKGGESLTTLALSPEHLSGSILFSKTHWLGRGWVQGAPKFVETVAPIAPEQLNRRVHLSVYWDGTDCDLYVDGQPGTKIMSSSNYVSNGQTSVIVGAPLYGGKPGGKWCFDGILHQLRYSGIRRYPKGFAPPTKMTADADTLALYNCDEGSGTTLNDSSGHMHHGQIVDAQWSFSKPADSPPPPPLPATGTISALEFDGKTHVEIPDLKRDDTREPLTVEAWLTAEGAFAAQETVFDLGGSAPVILSRKLMWSGGYRYLQVVPARSILQWSGVDAQPPAKVVSGERTHLALVIEHRDGKIEQRLYQAGALVASTQTNAGEPIVAEKNNSLIGAMFGKGKEPPGYGFRGTIDELRVSKIARYSEAFEPDNRLVSDGNTLALYHFDDGVGETLKDDSGHNRHGKIVGGAKWVMVGDKAAVVPATPDAPPLALAPFDAARARQLQQAWATYLKKPAEWKNDRGMEFVLIPPGEFDMGIDEAEFQAMVKIDAAGEKYRKGQLPRHRVRISRPFYLGRQEVTQKQYRSLMNSDPSAFSATGENAEAVRTAKVTSTDDYPVENLSWYDAIDFCNALSKQYALPNAYEGTAVNRGWMSDAGYRLPTEAEWEYACRAGTTTTHWYGDAHYLELPNALKDDGRLSRESSWVNPDAQLVPHPVGTKKENPFGLYDMHGNVAEWVWDWLSYTEYTRPAGEVAIDPRGPKNGTRRGLRGGFFSMADHHSRSAERVGEAPDKSSNGWGFRVVLPLDSLK